MKGSGPAAALPLGAKAQRRGAAGSVRCVGEGGGVSVAAFHAVNNGVEHMRDGAQIMRGRANVVRG